MGTGAAGECFHSFFEFSQTFTKLEKRRKHSPAARVFYISLVFSNARRVLSQCNTRLRLLYLLNKTENACFIVFRHVTSIS